MQVFDIFEELAREAQILPEGPYNGTVVGYEKGYTKGKGTPFTRIAIEIDKKKVVHTFIVCPHGFMEWAMPHLLGKEVLVTVRHREYHESLYLEAVIKETKDGNRAREG